jgi:hypothetical protein
MTPQELTDAAFPLTTGLGGKNPRHTFSNNLYKETRRPDGLLVRVVKDGKTSFKLNPTRRALRSEKSAAGATQAPAKAYVVTVPPVFYADHVTRDLPAGRVVKQTKRAVTVELTADELAELRSDAEHYAHSMADAGFEGRGLIASAKATLKALDAQKVEA